MKKTISFCLLLSCSGLLNAADGVKTFVAARHIRAGEEITAEALREVPAVAGPASLEPAEISGAEAVRPIMPGETLTRTMLRPARSVRPGDKIRVKIVLGRVTASAMFTALQGGAKGETIEARNQASGKMCLVKVEGTGEGSLGEVKK